jgi:hypothetical protein
MVFSYGLKKFFHQELRARLLSSPHGAAPSFPAWIASLMVPMADDTPFNKFLVYDSTGGRFGKVG